MSSVNNATIIIPSDADGTNALEDGDSVGLVASDGEGGEICAGQETWEENEDLAVAAAGSDELTDAGYQAGEELVYRVWRSDGVVQEATVTYESCEDDQPLCNDEGSYQTDAIYTIDEIEVESDSAPSIEIAPLSHTFGTVGVGGSAEQTTEVTNAGEVELHIEDITLLEDSGPFTITEGQVGDDSSLTLPPSDTHSVAVAYAPESASEEDEATLQVAHDATNRDSPVEVALEGAAEAPQAATAPSAIDTTVAAGEPLAFDQTIDNEATETAVLDVEVTNVPEFLALDDASAPEGGFDEDERALTLEPSESATLTWRFEATVDSTATFEGNLTHDTNDPERDTVTLPVTIDEHHAKIAADPEAIDFGTVLVDGSAAETLMITNEASSGPPLSGTAASPDSPFQLAGGPPEFDLDPGESAAVSVEYAPESTSARDTDVLEVSYSAGADEGTLEIDLEGTAEAPEPPSVAAGAESINFGVAATGSAVQDTFEVINDGDIELEGDVKLSSGEDLFALSEGAGSHTLAPGDTLRGVVSYAPESEGAHEGSVIFSYDGDEDVEIRLEGVGESPQISVEPEVADFGTTALRSDETATVTITNEAEHVATLTGEALVAEQGEDGPFSIPENGGPFELDPGDSTDLTVTYAPESASEEDEATLQVTHDATNHNSPVEVALEGAAEAPQAATAPSAIDTTVAAGEPLAFDQTVDNEAAETAVLEVETTDVPEFLMLEDVNAPDGTFDANARSLTLEPSESATLTWKSREGVTDVEETAVLDGSITYATNDPERRELNLTVSIEAQAAQIALSDDELDFGTVAVKGARAAEDDGDRTEAFTIANESAPSLDISGVAIAGTEAPFAILEGAAGGALGEGDDLDVVVAYDPAEAGRAEATVEIDHDADNLESPLKVDLEGQAEAPAVAFDPDDDFAFEVESNEAITFTQTIANEANVAALSVEEIALPTADQAPFDGDAFVNADVDPEASFHLEPGASKTIEYAFDGAQVQEAAELAGSLTYATNAGERASSVAITLQATASRIAGTARYPTLTEEDELAEGATLFDALGEAVAVTLRDEATGEVAQTTTIGEDGRYEFEGVEPGTYAVEADLDATNVATVDGAVELAREQVSTADAFRALRIFTGARDVAGGFHVDVADVNADEQINARDAFLIQRFAIGLRDQVEAGVWNAPAEAVTVEEGDVAEVDLRAAAVGDATLSGGKTDDDEPTLAATTAAPQTQASADGAGAPSSKATAPPEPGATFEVPVRVSQDAELGAYELAFSYDATRADFEGVSVAEATSGDVLTRAEGGTVRLSWLDPTGGEEPAKLEAGSELVTLTFAATGQAREGDRFALDLDGGTLVAPDGLPVEAGRFELAALTFGQAAPDEFAVEGPYPNPTPGEASLALDLPGDAEVRVAAYNTLGQRVFHVEASMTAGNDQPLQLDPPNLPSGPYFLRVTADLDGKTHQHTRRMTVIQ